MDHTKFLQKAVKRLEAQIVQILLLTVLCKEMPDCLFMEPSIMYSIVRTVNRQLSTQVTSQLN